MDAINQTLVNTTFSRLHQMDEVPSKKLFDQFGKAQPFVVTYLLAMEENMLPEEDHGTLLFLGLCIWECFLAAGLRPAQAGPNEIEAAEAKNTAFLEQLDEGNEFGMLEAIQKLMGSYNQMPLLGALMESLMTEHEEEPEMAPEHIGMALIQLKTVVDVLDQ